MNQCENTGASTTDCSQLLNTATLNKRSAYGNTNNGNQFMNQCENTGASTTDCSQLLNTATLNKRSGNKNLFGLRLDFCWVMVVLSAESAED